MKISTRALKRENERGLRTVDDEACGALRRARLKEGRKKVVAPGADRKDGADRDIVVEVGRSVERIDRNTEWRCGTQGFRQFRFLGKNGRHRGAAQGAPYHFVGGDIDILLLVAVRIDAAVPSGNARERPVRDQPGKFDCSGGNGLDHVSKCSAVRRLQRGPIEM